MNDLDLEDIETRLYSQVYHGSNEEPEQNHLQTNPENLNNLSKPTEMRRSGPRYFGPWSPGAKFQKHSSGKPSYTDNNKSDGLYGKKSNRPHKSEIAVNQVVVVSSNRPLQYSSSKKQRNRAKWKARLRDRKELKKQNILTDIKQESPKRVADNSVITLSDSEDESCIVVDNNWPVLSIVDSDDDSKVLFHNTNCQVNENSDLTLKNKEQITLNESLTDDVILVEPEVVPTEVINVDEEHELHEKNNVEIPSNDKTPNKKTNKQLQKERRELLSTPDSASNDFMSNSGVELHEKNFNFSLHGLDFNNGEFLKPAPKANETCETESSSSTTDANAVNLMKTAVFNEIDFPRDDIFAENNLESFGNFITPLRKKKPEVGAQSSPVHAPDLQNKNVYATDSSSESDLEESRIEKSKDIQKSKQLPELSHMDEMSKDVTPLQVSKKSKKVITMGSKYDFLDSEFSESPAKDDAKVCKKKKKKKKKSESNEENSSRVSRESSLQPADIEGDEVKRKKKKYSFTEVGEFERKKGSNNSIQDNSHPPDFIGTETKGDNQQNRQVESCSLTTNELTSEPLALKEREKNNSDNFTENNTHSSNDENKSVTDIGKTVLSQSVDGVTTSSDYNSTLNTNDCFQTEMILSSDSESVLSPLLEHSDIRLNCEDVNVASTSSPTPHGTNFSVRELQLKMSNDPKLWEILDSDRYPPGKNRGRRCNKCKQFGHGAIRCPNKLEPKCALCGEKGHYEPRCPNKICTQCGHRSPYSTNYCSSCFKYRNYQCYICSLKGHLPKTCPDLWRRYYLTASEGPLTTYAGSEMTDKRPLWCSGCAQSGHLEHSCRFYKSIYPPADPFIKSFEDIYREPTHDRIPPYFDFSPPPVSHDRATHLLQKIEHRHQANNCNQNVNAQSVNPYPNEMFVTGAQHFFHQLDPNGLQYPENTFSQNQDFNHVLPEYHNFEPPIDFTEYPLEGPKSVTKSARRNNSMFYNSSALQLQYFINEELRRLSKLSVLSNKVIRELRKRGEPRRSHIAARGEYFETLNMILFGVCKLRDGNMHLDRLKRFKRAKLKSKLGTGTRQLLHKSYSYIFGCDKHDRVNYHDLLRKI